MAEAYETQAFEEIYKHPNWKIEAETFENDFTKALYDDEAVKKEGQKALVQVSNILITYNQIKEFQQGVEYTYTDERNKIQRGIEKCQATLDKLEKKEQSEELSKEDKETREEAKAAIKRGKEKLDELKSDARAENEKRIKNKEVNAKDDEGQILSSLMLGGTGIGGQGYTITDNSIQDTRKGAQYIREQMTEKGTLLNQMALLDNAMNTGGIDLEGGGNTGDYLYGNDPQKKDGNDLQKKTLNDFLRDKDKFTVDATSQYLKDNGGEELNIEEIDRFREKNEEEQDQIIGAEGKGNNRMDIMDAARTRTLNDEAKARKGVKQTGLKGMWNSVKNFFGGGQQYVGALSQEEPQKKDKNKAPEQSGLKGAWNSVKNFFAGPNKNEDIDFNAMTQEQHAMLQAQGITWNVLDKKWRAGLTEPQKRVLRMLRYQQHEERVKEASASRKLLTASGVVNKGDTAAKAEELMSDRDKAIARELNEKKFLSTKDAEAVVKDPNAQAGRLMNSPKTARNMLGMYKMLTKNEQSIFNFRLALLAYLVPSRRNTIYEVLSQSHDAGVVGKEDLTDPARMYETISPYVKDDIRKKLPGKKQFPHEKVFMTMVDEYNQLRDDARGVSKKDHKDLIENQKNMSIAEVARELLNPASGLALFARLRLLTDESITDADIKKHIDRLSPEEQVLVNEFMEKLAREQNIKFEDLKKYVEEQKELDEKLKAKEAELQKVMKKIHDLENGMYMAGQLNGKKETRDLDNKSKDLDREIRDLQEKKDKTAAKRPEMEKDYNERVDWKNNREAQAITAVNKIRKDLFGLLTATPTAYDTDLEAQVPALRNRLLVITRLANRFLLDKFEETPDFEDKYKFKEFNPDREELYQAQIKEEKAGTLGQSQATKDENKRKEEEEKARIAAEKEMRKGLADRCVAMKNSVKDDEKLLSEELKNKGNVDAGKVGMAITRVVNTYLNFDPGAAVRIPDNGFPDVIPRLMRYNMAASQIKELLKDRPDANAAMSEETLQRIRRALKLQIPVKTFLDKRCAFLSTGTYGTLTAGEFGQKMQQIKEKGGEGATQEELQAYEALGESNEAGDALGRASADREEEIAPGTESGQTYLDDLETLQQEMELANIAGKHEGVHKSQFFDLTHQVDNLRRALADTFNTKTDIGAEAAEIAKSFQNVWDAAVRCADNPDEHCAQLVNRVCKITNDMPLKFTQAAYRTVEILQKNNMFQKGNHLWARVMVIGAPLIKGGTDFEGKLTGRLTLDNEEYGTEKLSKEEIHAEMIEQNQYWIDKTITKREQDKEAKSLSRFRALLGSADRNEMRQTLETYKNWDREDAEALANKRKHEKDLIDSIEEPEQKKPKKKPKVMPPKQENVPPKQENVPPKQENIPPKQENEPPKQENVPPKQDEQKKLTQDEIKRILAEQEVQNVLAKTGEEDSLIQKWDELYEQVKGHKTGFLGFFEDKEQNSKINELMGPMKRFRDLFIQALPKLEVDEEGQSINMAELKASFANNAEQLFYKANQVYLQANAMTSSIERDRKTDPLKEICFQIKQIAMVAQSVYQTMRGTDLELLLNWDNDGTTVEENGKKKRVHNRLDLRSYAWKQIKEGKLRYAYFFKLGTMALEKEDNKSGKKNRGGNALKKLREMAKKQKDKGEKPVYEELYQAMGQFKSPDQWNTEKSLEEEFKKNPLKPPVNGNVPPEQKNAPPEKEFEVVMGEMDEEEWKKIYKDIQNFIDQHQNNLEIELNEGDYEDAEGERKLTKEQKEAAKKEARRLAKEEADALRRQRENMRAKVTLPKYEPVVRAKRRARDDFDLTNENIPEEGGQPIEQKAVKNRNPQPSSNLSTQEKVAKAAGWALFGIPHYVGKPVKWIGNGVVNGVHFALRWAKKKASGDNSMQETSKIATRMRQDQIRNEISGVKQKPSDQEVITDTSRVPMNWALETAENPDLEPTVTVGATGVADANGTDFVNAHHAWMRINYTKRDPQNGRDIRYRVDVGYGPRGGFGLNGSKGGTLNAADQVATGAMMPGALWDERGNGFANAKTYKVNNRQVNQMLLEAEAYPAGGFNVVTRNCTTFVADVTQHAGVNTSDILQKTPLKLGAKYLTVPLLSLLSPATKMISGAHGLQKSGQDDLSFQRYGEKQITEDEMDLMKQDNGVHTEGYTPLNTLQSIQKSGSNETNALHGEFREELLQDDPDSYITNAGVKLKKAIGRTISKEKSRSFGQMLLNTMHTYRADVGSFKDYNPDRIRQLQKDFSVYIQKAIDFYYGADGCGGKPELRVPFLEYIGVLNRAKMSYDKAFREALRRENNAKFEESDISEQLKALTSGGSQKYTLNTGNGQEEMTSSPSLMIGYAKRGTSVGQTAEVQKKNQGKQKLLDALDTSVDADTAKLWQKESFSDKDVDLAFGTMQNQQEGLEHNKMEYQDNYDFTGAEVMQALIFERIYGGLKGRIAAGSWFKQPVNEQGEVDANTYNTRSKQFIDWLKQDMEISANSHSDEVAQIEKSIGKRLGLNPEQLNEDGRAAIQKEYRARLFSNYLVPLLVQAIFKKFGGEQYFSLYALLKEQFAAE